MARSALLPLCVAAGALLLCLRGAARAFVPAPQRAELRGDAAVGGGAGAAVGAAGLLTAPWAVLAELPPLEDLPLEDVAPKRQFGPSDTSFYGISFPMVLVGLACAVTWAAFWVSSLMPAKDKEGTYKTYIGGGMLPPEGYTNPLDPRVSEEYADQDDPLYEKMGTKAASSAIV